MSSAAQLSSGPDCSLVNFKYRLSLYQGTTGSTWAGHFQAGSSCSLEQNLAAEETSGHAVALARAQAGAVQWPGLSGAGTGAHVCTVGLAGAGLIASGSFT